MSFQISTSNRNSESLKIQSFWALPTLAIDGLKANDIMDFYVIVLVVSGVVIGVGLLFL